MAVRPDLTAFTVLPDLRRFLDGRRKVAFTPSPAVAQAVMAQAQGGPPPGGDPGQGGPPPGMPPGGPGGPPPGMDPGQGGPPPGGDPGQGGPPPGGPDPATQAAPPPPDPLAAKVDQLTQLVQQMVQANGGGPGGKPNTASLKFEPAHFHQIVHDVKSMKEVITRMADAMGIQVPASAMLHQAAPAPASTPPVPGMDPAAQGGAPPGGGAGPGGPPPSQIAQALPSLPPAVAKAAARLDFGRNVAAAPGDVPRPSGLAAALTRAAKRRA